MEQNHTTTPPWYLGRFCGFDTETTGIDVERDRIVTACVVQVGADQPTAAANWLANPGVEIPEAAAKVHGITTEKARAEGRPAAEVIEEIVAALAATVTAGVPVVAMNANFDFTILDREARRHGIQPLTDIVGDDLRVLDPLVIDKQVDTYRPGSRNLTALCAHYDVPLGNAHTSDADAIAACRVVWRLGTRFPKLGALSVDELHKLQVEWARAQGEDRAAYFRRTPGKERFADSVRTEWPLIPHPRKEGQ
ncbi:3'-5' exonuclease [Streptomyces olivaceoviridis]|uniref:3'-5' exonuclease n=1 Tax=Streptomyces olivaceoviridis TaxID=1921 RepID=UPI0036B3F0DF